mgnify:FL=1
MLPSNPVLLRAMSQAIDQQLRQPSSPPPPPPPPPSEEQQAARKRRQALAARILRGEDDPDEPMMEDEDEDEDEDDGANEPVEGDHEDDTLDGEDPIYDYSDYDESLDDYLEEDYYYYYGDYYSEINQTDSQEPQDKPFDIIEFLDNVDINVRLMPHHQPSTQECSSTHSRRLCAGICLHGGSKILESVLVLHSFDDRYERRADRVDQRSVRSVGSQLSRWNVVR